MAIITITRGVQSGGRDLARRLADRLGYRCMSREVISECARKYNIMEDELYKRLLEAPRIWQRLSKEHRRYLIYIQCSLVEAARQDNIVYHGYAGQLFLKGVHHALKLRLDAPLNNRIQAEMDEYGKDKEAAEKYIEKMDDEQNRWVKFLYGIDWHNPSLYDLSINLENITIDTVCGMVECTLKGEEFQTTERSVKALENLSLKCEVQAAIAADDNLWNQDIIVDALGSTIILRGSIKNAKTQEAIINIASQVKGVEKCESHLGLYSAPLKRGYFLDN